MKNAASRLDVLLINPHLEFPSDTSGRSSLYRKTEYLLNMGILSVATYLKSIGLSIELYDFTMIANTSGKLRKLIIENRPKFVGISNQSCHSYLSTIRYAKIIKEIDNSIKVVVGGLHASGIPDILLKACKEIDFVVVGEGELVMADLFGETNISGYKKIKVNSNQFILYDQGVASFDIMPRLDYTLYPNFKLFVPYVEESRGCNRKCTYCISPLVNRGIRIRNPEDIIKDIVVLKNIYGSRGFHFFIEANNFAVNHKKTAELAVALRGSDFSWRVESRVDTFPIHLMDSLSDAGLRVLDIGLESASPEMLLRMNKTKNPKKYLQAGINLAEEIARNGKCLLKLNIMLFYGETAATINTTREYLKTISSICPISIAIGPVRMDPGSEMYRNLTRSADLSIFENTFWGKVHCYPVDLSREISFSDANKICVEISQEFQTSEAYFEAK